MSKANFLKQEYRTEPPRAEVRRGIVDGENGQPAFTTSDTSVRWNATINNPSGIDFQFVPIDRNIKLYKENGAVQERSCDGMLLSDSERRIAFIELKDVQKGGNADAVDQLKNAAHPHFNYNMKDEMEEFRALKFVFFPTATIDL